MHSIALFWSTFFAYFTLRLFPCRIFSRVASCCTRFKSHFFVCCTHLVFDFIRVALFSYVVFSNCTFFVLFAVHVAPFLCCLMLHSLHVAPFFVLHSFGVVLFLCCTFFILNSFQVSLFCVVVFVLHLFRVVPFSCWIFCVLHSFMLNLFSCCLMLHYVKGTLMQISKSQYMFVFI